MRFEPPDLVDNAAHNERWSEGDRRYVERIIREGLVETFGVQQIQRTEIGLIAFDSKYVSFESVLFVKSREKPTLHAFEDLSRALLRIKTEAARQPAERLGASRRSRHGQRMAAARP